MFTQPDVAVVLRRLALKLEDGEDDDTLRICETSFRIPRFGFPLAQAIAGVPIARDCFVDARPRWDVDDVRFTPPRATFIVSLHSAPDMPEPLVDLTAASIKMIRVWRPNAEHRDVALEFTLRHQLERGDARDLAALLTAWESGAIYITFTEVRPPLLEGIEIDADDETRPHTH
jgi:hypothetical protein